MTIVPEREVDLSRALRGAADRGELHALFQPQVALDSGSIVAVEALCRWQHPLLGRVSPDEFIPLAEDDGTIGEIGQWMLREGCRRSVEWLERGHAVEIAVNVSAHQLMEPGFAEFVTEVIDETGAHPRSITLEITETARIDDIARVSAMLHRLRSTGIGVSIDDFGTGFSSVQQLLDLPASEIKIDRSLLRSNHAQRTGLLRTFVEFAKRHQVRTVAEGIESRQQLDLVRALGFDRAQGFLIGEALDAESLESRLVHQSH